MGSITMWKLFTVVAILTYNPSLGQEGRSGDNLNSLKLDKPLEDTLKRTYECPEYDIEFSGFNVNSVPVPGVTNWRICGRFCAAARDCKFWTFFWRKTLNAGSRAPMMGISTHLEAQVVRKDALKFTLIYCVYSEIEYL